MESDGYLVPPANGYALPEDQFTSIELTGADRPGLLSEVCAVLATLSCNIVKAEVWTHDGRTAAVIQVTDEATGRAVHDAGRLSRVQELLRDVMRGDGTCNHGGTGISAERRLHTLMLDSVGGGGAEEAGGGGDESATRATTAAMETTSAAAARAVATTAATTTATKATTTRVAEAMSAVRHHQHKY